MRRLDKTYVVHNGIVYTTQNVVTEGTPIEALYADLEKPYRMEDVIEKIQVAAERQVFFPSFDGGHIVYLEQSIAHTLACIEFEPSLRRTKFDRSLYVGGSAVLAFPYVYLFIYIGSGSTALYAYYRNTPIQTLDDELFETNLWNMYRGGNKCADTSLSHQQTGLISQIGLAVYAFWDNTYTEDHGLWRDARRKVPHHPSSISGWAFRSNWLFNWKKYITSFEWTPTYKSIGKLAEEFMSRHRYSKVSDFENVIQKLKREGREYYESEDWLD